MKHVIKVISANGEQDLNYDDDADYITIVKVGGENYQQTLADLEEWRKVFEQAVGDEDFKIFTHAQVHIEQIKVNGELIVK